LPLPTLAAVAGLAAAPTVVVLLRHGHDATGALVAAALVAGAAVAFAVDDPAEETLAASPTNLATRRLVRLSAIALGVAAMALLLVVLAALVGTVRAADLGRRAAELAATAGLAAGLGGAARRRVLAGAAPGAAVGAVLTVLLVSALRFRYRALPALVDSPHHARWWLLAAAGGALATWTWRDPAR
jgi:hypothetical protein